MVVKGDVDYNQLANGDCSRNNYASGDGGLTYELTDCGDRHDNNGRSAKERAEEFENEIDTNLPTRVGIDSSTTALGGMFIVANAAIGCGTLAFPSAFNNAGGLYVGIFMVFICACLCALSLLICGYTSGYCRTSEFYEVSRELLGKWAEILSQFFLIASNLGTCILYMIIIGDQIEQVMIRMVDYDIYCNKWFLDRRMCITVSSFIVVYPLCLVKRVDFLKYPSLLSVFSMVYVMFMVVYKYFEGNQGSVSPEPKFRPDHPLDVLKAFPTILFGYQCMTNACPVYANLKTKNHETWFKVTAGTIVICTMIYLPTAVFGYLTFTGTVQSNILKSYDSSDNMALIAQVTVMLSVMMTYPVIYFVARNAFDPLYTSVRTMANADYDPMESEAIRRYVSATLWFLFSLGAALFIPNITVAIDFAGTVASFFYLIFPGLFLGKLAIAKRHTVSNCTANGMIFFGGGLFFLGVGLFIQGFIQSVQGLLSPGSELSKCEAFYDSMNNATRITA